VGSVVAAHRHQFADADAFPVDADRWRALKLRIVRMCDALLLPKKTLREQRARGIPFTDDAARKLEAAGLGST
jgi:hypothetical protein